MNAHLSPTPRQESVAVVRWIETTREVYHAIVYDAHYDELVVFGTISHVDHPDYGYHMMTEWGFKGAAFPIIKIDSRDSKGATSRYFIAAVNLEAS